MRRRRVVLPEPVNESGSESFEVVSFYLVRACGMRSTEHVRTHVHLITQARVHTNILHSCLSVKRV